MTIFTFERSIRASPTAKMLFLGPCTRKNSVESRNDQGIIQNRSAKINTTVASLYLPVSSFIFRILPTSPIKWSEQNRVPRLGSLLCTRIRAGHLGSCAGQPGSGIRPSQLGE
jgi:hypothetical protein